MFGPQELGIRFSYSGADYNLNLVRSNEKSPYSVVINGLSYAVLGEENKLSTACELLSSALKTPISNFEDLKERLSSQGDVPFEPANRTNKSGVTILGTEHKNPSMDPILRGVINRAITLFYLDSKEIETDIKNIFATLEKEENQEILKLAREAPIPVVLPPWPPFPADTDIVNTPTILSGLTSRRVMLLGAVAKILGKTEELEAACKVSYRKTIPEGGAFLVIEESRELFYKKFGTIEEDKPCIIMESGMGDGAGVWDAVQGLLKNDAYGLSYDRAGLGFSDSGENQASVEQMITNFDNMLKLLEGKEIKAPYVLVGHSLGGTLIQLYAHRNPDKVKGIVLIDSAHEELPRPPPEAYPHYVPLPDDKIMPQSTAQALFPEANHDLNFVKEFNAINANDGHVKHYIKEETEKNKHYLYDLPLIVLSHGQYPENPTEAEKNNAEVKEEPKAELTQEQMYAEKLQDQLATRSTNSKKVECQPGTTHHIHIQHPRLVAENVRKLF